MLNWFKEWYFNYKERKQVREKEEARILLRDELGVINAVRAELSIAREETRRIRESISPLEKIAQSLQAQNTQLIEQVQDMYKQIDEEQTARRDVTAKTARIIRQLETVQKAHLFTVLANRNIDVLKKLGIERGVVETYKQHRSMLTNILNRFDELKLHLFKSEIERLGLENPHFKNLPIAIYSAGEMIYSTNRFQRRLKGVGNYVIIGKIRTDEELNRLLGEGKEVTRQYAREDVIQSHSYSLSFIPYRADKQNPRPDAIFIYIRPSERQEKVSKMLRDFVRNIRDEFSHRIGHAISYSPPPSALENNSGI